MRTPTPADAETWGKFATLLETADEPTKAVVRQMLRRCEPLTDVVAEMERRA